MSQCGSSNRLKVNWNRQMVTLAVQFATNYNSKHESVFNAKYLKDILAYAKTIPSFIIITNLLVGFKSKVHCLHSTHFCTESNIWIWMACCQRRKLKLIISYLLLIFIGWSVRFWKENASPLIKLVRWSMLLTPARYWIVGQGLNPKSFVDRSFSHAVVFADRNLTANPPQPHR